MTRRKDALLRQEVQELTELLQTAPVMRRLRESLKSRGLVVEELLLAGLVEDEDEHEWGALVTKDGKVYLYERSTRSGSVGFLSFEESTDVTKAIQLYPAVSAAVQSVGGKGLA